MASKAYTGFAVYGAGVNGPIARLVSQLGRLPDAPQGNEALTCAIRYREMMHKYTEFAIYMQTHRSGKLVLVIAGIDRPEGPDGPPRWLEGDGFDCDIADFNAMYGNVQRGEGTTFAAQDSNGTLEVQGSGTGGVPNKAMGRCITFSVRHEPGRMAGANVLTFTGETSFVRSGESAYEFVDPSDAGQGFIMTSVESGAQEDAISM